MGKTGLPVSTNSCFRSKTWTKEDKRIGFFLFFVWTPYPGLVHQSRFSGSIRSSSCKDISPWRWMTFVSDDISFWKKIHRYFALFSCPQHWQKDTGETASLSRSGCQLHLRPKKLQLEDDLYNLVKLQPPFKVRIPWIPWMDWYWYPLIGIVTNLESLGDMDKWHELDADQILWIGWWLILMQQIWQHVNDSLRWVENCSTLSHMQETTPLLNRHCRRLCSTKDWLGPYKAASSARASWQRIKQLAQLKKRVEGNFSLSIINVIM